MSEEYKMQRIKEYLIFHIKDSKEQRELLDYLDQLQQKENIIKEVREINIYIYNNLANIDYGEVKCKINRVLEILDEEEV